MILADKIIKLRRQSGFSQEELAARLNVSRQSVSKWESGTSIPDLNKIIKLSEIFGVSTDYLLKDEIEDEASGYTEEYEYNYENNSKLRKVTLQEAAEYLDEQRKGAFRIAAGVALCILSPVPMILLGGISEIMSRTASVSGNVSYATAEAGITDAAGGIGVVILLAMIAAAVALFISTGIKLSKYEYLDKEPISPEYGVAGLAESRKEKFENTYKNSMVAGACLCILCAVPIIVGGAMSGNDMFMIFMVSLLFIMIASGVFLFVRAGMINESFQKLLEEGDYSRERKKNKEKFESLYWPIVVAVYLLVSFLTGQWAITWIIWPVAGVLSAVIENVIESRNK